MTIVFATHVNAPGGAELSLLRYMQLTHQPESFRVVSLRGGGVWDDLPPGMLIAPSNALIEAERFTWLRRTLRRLDPEIVVSNSMRIGPYVTLAKPRNARHYYYLHDAVGEQSAMGTVANTISRRLVFPGVEHFLVNSEWTEGTLHQLLPEAPTTVFHPLCCDDRPAPERELHDPVRLLYLGRISPWKAPHVAVEAVGELRRSSDRNFELTIVGDSHFGEDDYKNELLGRIEDLGLTQHVHLKGHVKDVTPQILEHDVLLHCSVKPEPFGRVIVEAMSLGMPPVVTNIGAPADIVPNGVAGITYAPGDAGELARAVLTITDPEHYHAFCAAAKMRSNAFAEGPLVQSLDEFFEKDAR